MRCSYSVGTDGSFPLLESVPLFVNHWADILAHYPAWKAKYPDGPAAGEPPLLIFTGNDYILAGQVLLDMASHFHAKSDSAAVYDEGFISQLTIEDNVMAGAVCAVSLYRTRNSTIGRNTIVANSSTSGERELAMYGVELGMSHNISVHGNALDGEWRAGIIAQGAPLHCTAH